MKFMQAIRGVRKELTEGGVVIDSATSTARIEDLILAAKHLGRIHAKEGTEALDAEALYLALQAGDPSGGDLDVDLWTVYRSAFDTHPDFKRRRWVCRHDSPPRLTPDGPLPHQGHPACLTCLLGAARPGGTIMMSTAIREMVWYLCLALGALAEGKSHGWIHWCMAQSCLEEATRNLLDYEADEQKAL